MVAERGLTVLCVIYITILVVLVQMTPLHYQTSTYTSHSRWIYFPPTHRRVYPSSMCIHPLRAYSAVLCLVKGVVVGVSMVRRRA